MTKRPKRRSEGDIERAREPQPGRSWRRAAILVGFVIVSLMGVWLWSTRERTPQPDMSPQEYIQAGRLAEDTSFVRARAWYAQGVREYPESFPLQVHLGQAFDYGVFEGITVRGQRVPMVRSSRERFAQAMAALQSYERARRLEPRLPEPHSHTGNLYAAWGLSEDALIELERAFMLGERREHYGDLALDIIEVERRSGMEQGSGVFEFAFPESNLVRAREEHREQGFPITP